MRGLERSIRVTSSALLFSSLSFTLLTSENSAAAMQLDKARFKSFPGSSDQPESSREVVTRTSDDSPQTDAFLLMLQEKIKSLTSVTAELREAQSQMRRTQEQLSARILQLEKRQAILSVTSMGSRRLNTLTQPSNPASTTDPPRLWRSISGTTIIASLINIQQDQVVLRRNGKEVAVEVSHLCADDRQFIEQKRQSVSNSTNITEKTEPVYPIRRANLRDVGVIR
jgi:TolA-binding protein